MDMKCLVFGGNCFVNIYLSHTPNGNVALEIQLFRKCTDSRDPVLHLIASFIHCKKRQIA